MSYFPGLNTLTTGIKNTLTALLPQNEHGEKAANLNQKIQSLQASLIDQTSELFKSEVTKTIAALQTKKEKYLNDLSRINGSYYQDPKSTLKRAWDTLVGAVEVAGFKIERADQIDAVSTQLNLDSNEANQTAKEKIRRYQYIEKKRNKRQSQLNQILGTEKAHLNPTDSLTLRKELLEQKYRELCGNYFGDPNGQLDQAWQKYQTAIAHGSTGENSLACYRELDAYRKQIEAQLYDIEQQLSLPVSEHTFEVLTTESIATQILELQNTQKEEAALSGIDWTRLSLNPWVGVVN